MRKHGGSVAIIQRVRDGVPILFVDPTGKKRSLLIGPDPTTNRLWTIVLSGGRDGIYYPRSCWPSKRQERRLYDEATTGR